MFSDKSRGKSPNKDAPLLLDQLGPNDSPRVIAMPKGVVARQDPDGSVTVRHPDGSEISASAQGHCRGRFCTVDSVTVADIAYVTEHYVNRVHETVSHVVRFLNGGTLCYAVDFNGRVIDCEFSGMQVSLQEGHLIVGCTEMALSLELRKPRQLPAEQGGNRE
ncbi:hypothetical protein [Cupriavidus campinensis]|uniref:Uncharacterized protein n=1 Tax=Cupriavidus campinensis TaxID=151783 RepID=A0AAE9I2X9_9BURK|nr:hypothetical protein [Cupriavidus campinensis]URF04660.1 hypothetical protein M5D45_02045 [Cupriavidus campinensis]